MSMRKDGTLLLLYVVFSHTPQAKFSYSRKKLAILIRAANTVMLYRGVQLVCAGG